MTAKSLNSDPDSIICHKTLDAWFFWTQVSLQRCHKRLLLCCPKGGVLGVPGYVYSGSEGEICTKESSPALPSLDRYTVFYGVSAVQEVGCSLSQECRTAVMPSLAIIWVLSRPEPKRRVGRVRALWALLTPELSPSSLETTSLGLPS